jgi:predicted metal-dependent peptidase
MDLDAVNTKLTAARTRLILDKPFLGALVLRLPMVPAKPDWCKTTATDARKFYFNPEYIDALDIEQTQFVLAHEALHCALSHFARREHRVKKRWDIACDYAVNPILLKDDLKPPPGILNERSYDGMTAEEIYPYIQDNPLQETLDDHVYDEDQDQDNEGDGKGQSKPDEPRDQKPDDQPGEGDGEGAGSSAPQGEIDPNAGGADRPPPLSSGESDELSIQWQQRMAGAAQQAMQSGKMSGDMARMVDYLLQPKLPWRMLLSRYMTATARDDYSYTRPSTRRGDPAIYPSLRSAQIEVVVALDVSGSITDKEISEFVAEINAIKSLMRARIILHACDSELAEGGPWVFESWDELVMPEHFAGGGGTSFRPVMEWAEAQDRQPDLLVYFTDAKGEFPEYEPSFPVIWLVKGKAQVPWGQRIQLN